MPIGTPFHNRTSALNQSQEWRGWSGYLGAGLYEMYHEREYFAIRTSAALIDVSPLFKYEITGPQAADALNRIMTRDIRRCKVGQVMYSPWCDDAGMVIDDGTVACLKENHFRVTSVDPSLRWFLDCTKGFEVLIEDRSEELGALALQGPNSGSILENLFPSVVDLSYFRLLHAELDDFSIEISRTGYTGDLGYELWVHRDHALELWDRVVNIGADYGLQPVGLAAMDIARIEAGYVLIDVDYIPSPKAKIPEQKSSPDELGLGWTVSLTPGNDFVGRAALERNLQKKPKWALAGLEVDWTSLEEIFGAVNLPPQVAGRSNRTPVPLYTGHRQVGYVTSQTFSPILKKNIALATVEDRYSTIGTQLEMEFTVEHQRKAARAAIVPFPFYDPPQRRA